MPSVDLIAVRDGSGPSSGPAFAGGAQHLVEANRRPGRGERLRRLLPGTAVSAVVHVFVVIAGLIIWRAMLQDLTAAEPISVEIVHSIPGEDSGSGKAGSDAPEAGQAAPKGRDAEAAGAKSPDAKSPDAKSPDVAPPDAKAPDTKPAAPKPAAPKPPEPKRSALDDALPAPDLGPTSPPAPAPAGALTRLTGQTRAAPAPVPGPSFVAPPPEPKAAATQPDRAQVANAADSKVSTPKPPPLAVAPPVPPVLSAPGGEASVPAPPPQADATAKPDQPAADGDPKAAPDPTAQLAAALPQSSFGMPATFRAVMSGQGNSAGTQYKGAVFGALGHGRAAEIAQQAEQRGLKGQVIVRFTVDDAGAIDSLSILHSSGSSAVDQAAEAMVRGAAPFPPPPPGSPRVFTPALAFGS